MGTSHHGVPPDPEAEKRQRELMERFVAQAEGKAKRAYSQGRVNADDDGDLAMAVSADPVKQIVIIRFGKPVEWLGLHPKEVNGLINLLKNKLGELGEVCEINIGG
jgi:hypothetical protein